MSDLYQRNTGAVRPKLVNIMKTWWPTLIAGLAIAFEALVYNIRFGDFSAKYAEMASASPGDLIIHPGNGRIIVDGIVPYFMSHCLVVFLMLTVVAVVILLYNIAKILKIHGVKFNIIAALGLVILFPFGPIFASAGPFATILVYLWPAAAMAYGITILTDKKTSILQFILKLCAIFYACNQEQFAIMTLMLFISFFIRKLFAKEKISWQQIIGLVIAAISTTILVAVDLLTRVDNKTEMRLFFPNFAQIPLPRKIDMGFVDTMQHFFVNPFFLLFVVLILILILAIKRKKLIAGAIASAQLILLFVPNSNEIVSKVNLIIASWNIKNYSVLLSTNGVPQSSIHSMASLMPDLYFLAMIALFVWSLTQILPTRKSRITLIYILFVGFCARMILSFSPTIYASADRTFFPILLALFFVFLWLIKDLFFVKKIASRAESV
ncbi:MAG: hypothetical protein WAW91_00880 [Candidatus Nanoperiomorbaceae bacterium]